MTAKENNQKVTEENKTSSVEESNDSNTKEAQPESQNALVEKLKKELEEATQEKNKSYDNYVRVIADSENLRKRSAKEKEDALKYGSENLFKELLPVLDSMDQAFKETHSESDEEKKLNSLKEGVELVSKKLIQALEKHGLKIISSTNSSYNPNLHQAVQTEISKEVKEPTVKAELMKGYELNGRLIRPSMVSVLLPDTTE